MKIRHLILMLLKKWGGKIEGKTNLQKQIYFISLLLDKDLGYKPHYYGPYSTEVENSLNELIGAGFVNVTKDIYGIDMTHGFESKRYDFSLTESGKNFSNTLAEEHCEEYNRIKEFVGNLKTIGTPNYLSLSIAAKAYFIIKKENTPLTRTQIQKKAAEFGWKVGENDNDTAIEILKEMDLVEEV